MQDFYLLICFLFIFIVLILINVILKSKHYLLSALKSFVCGPLLLIALNATQSYTTIKFPLNLVSFGLSALLGVPGVGAIALFNSLL